MPRLVLAVLSLAVFPVLMSAQQGRGTISGVVSDASDAAVPGASVKIVNVGTNVVFATQTNAVGNFTAPSLPASAYTITVEKQGFKKSVRSGVTLQVDQHAEIDFRLEVGAAAESIEVTAAATQVDTGSATVGTVIGNRRIEDLPLNGRNVLALVMLTPGVKSQSGPTNSGFADRGVMLSSISVNGGPSALNSFVLDGANNNNSYLADVNVNPTVDAIQEFKVQSNVMSAEFGFTAGGVVNMVTKSGTNDLHGTAYEFVRNDVFDARRLFAASKEPFHYNQYGFSAGGPVYIPKVYNGRNRSFFFFNFEEWRYNHSASNIMSMPIATQRNGDFSQLRDANGVLIPVYDPDTTAANPSGSGFVRTQFPGNVIPPSRLDPVSKNMLQFYPTPNQAPSNPYTNANNWIGQVSEIRSMRQYTAKGDQQFGAKNSLSGRFMYYRHYNDNGYFSAYPDPNVRNRLDNYVNYNVVVTDTHTFSPRLLNEFRVSVARQHFPFQAYSYGQNWPQKLGLPDSVPPYTLPRVGNGLPGFAAFSVGLRANLTWQFVEMLTYIHGNHSMKYGFDFRLLQANNYQREVPSGDFQFAGSLTGNPQSQAGTGSSFATFMLGAVSSASLTAYGGETEQSYSTSFFFQDDWKVTRRLNVNLGLRYDYQQWGHERHNGTSNFDPFVRNPDNGFMGKMEYATVDYGTTPFAPVYTALGPRVGFAYDMQGNAKTILRGGYAIFYPQVAYRDLYGNTAGFANTSTSYNPPGGNSNLAAFQFKNGLPFPATQPLGAKLGPSAFLGQGVTWDQNNGTVPMSQQWTMSLQHQFPRNWMVDAAYTANHTTHLVAGGYDYNQLDMQYLGLGLALQDQVPNPYAGKVPGSLGSTTIARSQALKIYPYYTGVTVRNPHLGSGIYHAFLLTVEKRMAAGVSFLASYTNGKLISDSQVTPMNFGNVEQVGIVGYQNGKFDRRAERSLDPTDVSQRLVLSGVFELPFGKGRRWKTENRVFNAVIGGWQLNLIAVLQTGNPVPVSGASNNLASRPNSTGKSAKLDNPTASLWFDTKQFINPPLYTYGNLGRVLPDVRQPGARNFDISFVKDTAIVERVRLQFRFEMFNFVNHPNLGLVNTGFSPGTDGLNRSSTFGTITSARDPRIMQLGLKLLF